MLPSITPAPQKENLGALPVPSQDSTMSGHEVHTSTSLFQSALMGVPGSFSTDGGQALGAGLVLAANSAVVGEPNAVQIVQGVDSTADSGSAVSSLMPSESFAAFSNGPLAGSQVEGQLGGMMHDVLCRGDQQNPFSAPAIPVWFAMLSSGLVHGIVDHQFKAPNGIVEALVEFFTTRQLHEGPLTATDIADILTLLVATAESPETLNNCRHNIAANPHRSPDLLSLLVASSTPWPTVVTVKYFKNRQAGEWVELIFAVLSLILSRSSASGSNAQLNQFGCQQLIKEALQKMQLLDHAPVLSSPWSVVAICEIWTFVYPNETIPSALFVRVTDSVALTRALFFAARSTFKKLLERAVTDPLWLECISILATSTITQEAGVGKLMFQEWIKFQATSVQAEHTMRFITAWIEFLQYKMTGQPQGHPPFVFSVNPPDPSILKPVIGVAQGIIQQAEQNISVIPPHQHQDYIRIKNALQSLHAQVSTRNPFQTTVDNNPAADLPPQQDASGVSPTALNASGSLGYFGEGKQQDIQGENSAPPMESGNPYRFGTPINSTGLGSVPQGLVATYEEAATVERSIEGVGLGHIVSLLDDYLITKHVNPNNTHLNDIWSFIFNALSPDTVDQKANELLMVLTHQNLPAMLFHLTTNRVAKERNHHELFLKFLERLACERPNFMILDNATFLTYDCMNVLMKYMDVAAPSRPYREVLKNLGSWMGATTWGRESPIYEGNLDLRGVIVVACEKGRLRAVLPMVCAILEHTKLSTRYSHTTNSKIFQFISMLRSIHSVVNLKTQLQIEIELLFKHLDINPASILNSDSIPPIPPNSPDMQQPSGDVRPGGISAQTGRQFRTPNGSLHQVVEGDDRYLQHQARQYFQQKAPQANINALFVNALLQQQQQQRQEAAAFQQQQQSAMYQQTQHQTLLSSMLNKLQATTLQQQGAGNMLRPQLQQNPQQPVDVETLMTRIHQLQQQQQQAQQPQQQQQLQTASTQIDMFNRLQQMKASGVLPQRLSSLHPAQLLQQAQAATQNQVMQSVPTFKQYAGMGAMGTETSVPGGAAAVDGEKSFQPDLSTTSAGRLLGAGLQGSSESLLHQISEYVVISPSLAIFQLQPQLKAVVPVAIGRATKEALQTISDRVCAASVSITVTTVQNDFVFEKNIKKMRYASRLFVCALAGFQATGLMLYSLRVALSSQLRNRLQLQVGRDNSSGNAEQTSALLEQVVQVLVNDNIDICCALVQQACMEKALYIVDRAMDKAILRRNAFTAATIGDVEFVDQDALDSSGLLWRSLLPESLRKNNEDILVPYNHLTSMSPLNKLDTTADSLQRFGGRVLDCFGTPGEEAENQVLDLTDPAVVERVRKCHAPALPRVLLPPVSLLRSRIDVTSALHLNSHLLERFQTCSRYYQSYTIQSPVSGSSFVRPIGGSLPFIDVNESTVQWRGVPDPLYDLCCQGPVASQVFSLILLFKELLARMDPDTVATTLPRIAATYIQPFKDVSSLLSSSEFRRTRTRILFHEVLLQCIRILVDEDSSCKELLHISITSEPLMAYSVVGLIRHRLLSVAEVEQALSTFLKEVKSLEKAWSILVGADREAETDDAFEKSIARFSASSTRGADRTAYDDAAVLSYVITILYAIVMQSKTGQSSDFPETIELLKSFSRKTPSGTDTTKSRNLENKAKLVEFPQQPTEVAEELRMMLSQSGGASRKNAQHQSQIITIQDVIRTVHHHPLVTSWVTPIYVVDADIYDLNDPFRSWLGNNWRSIVQREKKLQEAIKVWGNSRITEQFFTHALYATCHQDQNTKTSDDRSDAVAVYAQLLQEVIRRRDEKSEPAEVFYGYAMSAVVRKLYLDASVDIDSFDQMVYYQLFEALDPTGLAALTEEEATDCIKRFAYVFLEVSPLRVPSFSYAWIKLLQNSSLVEEVLGLAEYWLVLAQLLMHGLEYVAIVHPEVPLGYTREMITLLSRIGEAHNDFCAVYSVYILADLPPHPLHRILLTKAPMLIIVPDDLSKLENLGHLGLAPFARADTTIMLYNGFQHSLHAALDLPEDQERVQEVISKLWLACDNKQVLGSTVKILKSREAVSQTKLSRRLVLHMLYDIVALDHLNKEETGEQFKLENLVKSNSWFFLRRLLELLPSTEDRLVIIETIRLLVTFANLHTYYYFHFIRWLLLTAVHAQSQEVTSPRSIVDMEIPSLVSAVFHENTSSNEPSELDDTSNDWRRRPLFWKLLDQNLLGNSAE